MTKFPAREAAQNTEYNSDLLNYDPQVTLIRLQTVWAYKAIYNKRVPAKLVCAHTSRAGEKTVRMEFIKYYKICGRNRQLRNEIPKYQGKNIKIWKIQYAHNSPVNNNSNRVQIREISQNEPCLPDGIGTENVIPPHINNYIIIGMNIHGQSKGNNSSIADDTLTKLHMHNHNTFIYIQ